MSTPSKTELLLVIEKWAHDVLDNKYSSPGSTSRWLLCAFDGGSEVVDDCACCLTKPEDYIEKNDCGCRCHERIESLADTLLEYLHSKEKE